MDKDPMSSTPEDRRATCPQLYAPQDGYVLIVTYGRSGSTLLQNVLNSIPGYCIRGENANTLAHLARSWHALSVQPTIRQLLSRGIPTEPSNPWYGAERLNLDALPANLAEVFVRDVLTLPPGTRVGGFKEIRFTDMPAFFHVYMSFLRQALPRVRFVYNTRNHASVAKSSWWAHKPEALVRTKLRKAEELFAADIAAHPDDTVLLHYDDYNGQPEAFRRLFAFLGEPFDVASVAQVLGQQLNHCKPTDSHIKKA